MQITYRQYPHPVLCEFDNGYNSDRFNCDVDAKIVNGNIAIDVEFFLSSKTLEELLNNKMVKYVIHIECKSTRYRKVYSTFENNYNIGIDSRDINKEIELCIFIIANNKIEKFSSNDFIDDFKGIEFSINKGEVLAIAKGEIISIDKKSDVLNKNDSIFTIIPDEDKGNKLTWSTSGEKILIKISKDNFSRYKAISAYERFDMLLANVIVVPVLTEIIYEIKRDGVDNEDSYKILVEQLEQIGYDSEKIKNDQATNIAYKLLGNMIENSLISIENIIKGDDE